MVEQDIRDAYIKIRSMDNTIPDDVLNLMKQAAIDRLKKRDLYYYTKAELLEHLETYK